VKYNPEIHHRCSIRLQGYDYSTEGAYYVTVCVQDRECLFGDVVCGEARLNVAGLMVESVWRELHNKFPLVEIDTFVVMPNHFHGIISIVAAPEHRGPNVNVSVGAALCGRPDFDFVEQEGRPHRAAPTLGEMIDWFKTMTTNAYIRGVKQSLWPPFPGRLWQRGYYERILRGEKELNGARRYILENPMKWAWDKENPENDPGEKPGEQPVGAALCGRPALVRQDL
jgi:REP element-mobilizing transposase RayT